MTFTRILAATALTGLLAGLVPSATVLADGRASTRNIILGIGAATYLILQHNKKVHQKYAEDAAANASLAQQRNDAWTAYSAEKRAYQNQLAETQDLEREVAYQHRIVVQQRTQLASLGVRTAQPAETQRTVASSAPSAQVAFTGSSYGWGTL